MNEEGELIFLMRESISAIPEGLSSEAIFMELRTVIDCTKSPPVVRS